MQLALTLQEVFFCVCRHKYAFNKTTHSCLKYACPKKSACGTLESSIAIATFLKNDELDSLNATLLSITGAVGPQMSLAIVSLNSSNATTELQVIIKSATTGGVDVQKGWNIIAAAMKNPNSSLRTSFPDVSNFVQLNPADNYIPTHYSALWGLLPVFLLALLCAFWRPLVALFKKKKITPNRRMKKWYSQHY